MSRISVILNQKGGVGKTTTVHALATGLTNKGYTVLVVDTDPQGNISYAMRADVSEKGLYEAMREEATAAEIIQHTPQGDIIPSTLLLTAADLEFTQTGREYILDSILEPIKENYSHIIIDSPPALGILTVNALVACTDVIIPLTADIFALQGLSQLCKNIDRVKKFCNKNVHIAGLLLTRYSSRSILSRELKEAIESKAIELNTGIYNTIIREGVAVRETQTQQTNLFDYAPSSNPAVDYAGFISEYLNQEKGSE